MWLVITLWRGQVTHPFWVNQQLLHPYWEPGEPCISQLYNAGIWLVWTSKSISIWMMFETIVRGFIPCIISSKVKLLTYDTQRHQGIFSLLEYNSIWFLIFLIYVTCRNIDSFWLCLCGRNKWKVRKFPGKFLRQVLWIFLT